MKYFEQHFGVRVSKILIGLIALAISGLCLSAIWEYLIKPLLWAIGVSQQYLPTIPPWVAQVLLISTALAAIFVAFKAVRIRGSIPSIAGTWTTKVGRIVTITQEGYTAEGAFPDGNIFHKTEGSYDPISGKFHMTTVRTDASKRPPADKYAYIETWKVLDKNHIAYETLRNADGEHEQNILTRLS